MTVHDLNTLGTFCIVVGLCGAAATCISLNDRCLVPDRYNIRVAELSGFFLALGIATLFYVQMYL